MPNSMIGREEKDAHNRKYKIIERICKMPFFNFTLEYTERSLCKYFDDACLRGVMCAMCQVRMSGIRLSYMHVHV